MASRFAVALAQAHAVAPASIPGHPWTQHPFSYEHDAAVCAQDVSDSLLHSCPYNRPLDLGTCATSVQGSVCYIPLSYASNMAIFYRPCRLSVEAAGMGKMETTTAAAFWHVRGTESLGIVHSFLSPPKHRRQPVQLDIGLQHVAWSTHRSAVATFTLAASCAPMDLLITARTCLSDDGRCTVRSVAVPALTYLLHHLRKVGSDSLHASWSAARCATTSFTSGCIVGVRQPFFLEDLEWSVLCSAVLNPKTVTIFHAIPDRLRGSMYESLAVGACVAALMDATKASLAKRVSVVFPCRDLASAVCALQNHVDAGEDLHTLALQEQAAGTAGSWLRTCVSLAENVASLAQQYLVESVCTASGIPLDAAMFHQPLIGPCQLYKPAPLCVRPPLATTPPPVRWLERMHADRYTVDVSEGTPVIAWPTGRCTLWHAGPHSSWQALTLSQRVFTAWQGRTQGACVLVPCPQDVVWFLNTLSGEMRPPHMPPDGTAGLNTPIPSPWSLQAYAVNGSCVLAGSPVWVSHQDQQAAPFSWDHHVRALDETTLARATFPGEGQSSRAHPLSPYLLPYPWMYIVHGTDGPAMFTQEDCSSPGSLPDFVEHNWMQVMQRAFRLPCGYDVRLDPVTALPAFVHTLTGLWSNLHPTLHEPFALPAEVQELGCRMEVMPDGRVGVTSPVSNTCYPLPCLPYSLEDGITDALMFYPINADTGMPVSEVTCHQKSQWFQGGHGGLARCNVANNPVDFMPGCTWSPQPGLVTLVRAVRQLPASPRQQFLNTLGTPLLNALMVDMPALRLSTVQVSEYDAPGKLQSLEKLWSAAVDKCLDWAGEHGPVGRAVAAKTLSDSGCHAYVVQLLWECDRNLDRKSKGLVPERVTPDLTLHTVTAPKCLVCTKSVMALRRKDAFRVATWGLASAKYGHACRVHASDFSGLVERAPTSTVKCAECLKPYLATHGIPGSPSTHCSRHASPAMVFTAVSCSLCPSLAYFSGRDQVFCHAHLAAAGTGFKTASMCILCTQVRTACYGRARGHAATHCDSCGPPADLVPMLCRDHGCGAMAVAGLRDCPRQWCKEHAPAGHAFALCSQTHCANVATCGRVSGLLFCSQHGSTTHAVDFGSVEVRLPTREEVDAFLLLADKVGGPGTPPQPVWSMEVALAQPVLSPFVAVSNASGRICQIVDERVQPVCRSSIVYKHYMACSVPYCCLPACNGNTTMVMLLCAVHTGTLSHVFSPTPV